MRKDRQKILAALLALALAVSLCACAAAPAGPSSQENNSPSSQPGSESEPDSDPAPGSSSQAIGEDGTEEANKDVANAVDGGENVGNPEIWMMKPGDKDPDTVKAIWEPLNEAVQQLSQQDEALMGLTQFNLLAQLEYDTYDDVTAYYPFRNSEKEIVTYRVINCSMAQGEDKEFYIVEVFSFEDWKQE